MLKYLSVEDLANQNNITIYEAQQLIYRDAIDLLKSAKDIVLDDLHIKVDFNKLEDTLIPQATLYAGEERIKSYFHYEFLKADLLRMLKVKEKQQEEFWRR